MKMNTDLLKRCRAAYDGLSTFRSRRRKYKDFAFGRQWNDAVVLPDGRVVSERQRYLMTGREPVTNNLIRQMIKAVVGRYRFLRMGGMDAGATDDDASAAWLGRALEGRADGLDNLDARTLEEFLISGCAAQRLSAEGVENVSPSRLFWEAFSRPDGSDCRFMGMVHTMDGARLVREFSGGDAGRIEHLLELTLQHSASGDEWLPPTGSVPRGDVCTVIEVWRRVPMLSMHVYDPEAGRLERVAYSSAQMRALQKENRRRVRRGEGESRWRPDVTDCWEQTWLTTDGEVLGSTTYGEDARPAIMLQCYPMVDGEIHSLVEDVMSQQRCVNRIIALLDEILEASAKGVLLFPSDQLPQGMTWGDVQQQWRTPGALIPFRRTSKHVMPTQVATPATSEGAAKLLDTQLKMFDDIAGVSRLTRQEGSSTQKSANTLRREFENSLVSILDLLSTFHSFVMRRDAEMAKGKEVSHG